MPRISYLTLLGLILSALCACGAPTTPVPAKAANFLAPRDQLGKIVARYSAEQPTFENSISAQGMADSLARERRYLADISAVPRAALDAKSRLTYDIFKRQRESAVEGFTYPTELLAVDFFSGMPQQLAQRAADLRQPPAPGGQDFEHWLRRIDDFAPWTQQVIANMREGIRRGYTTPRAVIERALPPLDALGEDIPSNLFYQHLGAGLGGPIKDKLLPAFRKLHDFLQREYLPRARSSLGLSALPLGKAWYAYRVRTQTSTLLTPTEIHDIGVTEVERIRARMASIPAATPPKPAAADTALAAVAALGATAADGGDLFSAYAELKQQIVAALPTLFSIAPPTDFDMRAAERWAEAATPFFYRPAEQGVGRPAILYVDPAYIAARPVAQLTASFLQESIPGLHYQSSVQQAQADLPNFRRYGAEPAFVQGWGLYAASLGEELGLIHDEEAKAGVLRAQLRCAVALVVDTGLHAEGWTRAQAFDYLRVQLSMDEAAANLLVDRFVALPGNALACKIGELRFQSLRSRAQQALGTRFDIREFHTELLNDGAMPLDILEAKMKVWEDSQN